MKYVRYLSGHVLLAKFIDEEVCVTLLKFLIFDSHMISSFQSEVFAVRYSSIFGSGKQWNQSKNKYVYSVSKLRDEHQYFFFSSQTRNEMELLF